jgi:hypothetical protein
MIQSYAFALIIRKHKMRKCLLSTLTLIVSGLVTGCSSEDIDVTTQSSINYTLTMSPDLLKFVTPQVVYVDENGNIVTLTGIEELDGKVIENKAEISASSGGSEVYASGWTQQVITGTGYKGWTFQMKFNRLDFHSFMGVRYIRNDFTEDIDGKNYDFHHSINTSIIALKSTITEKKSMSTISQSSDVKAYSDSHVSITLMDYHQGDDLEKYLDNLTQNPDKAGYYVDGDGNVTRRDEFDL